MKKKKNNSKFSLTLTTEQAQIVQSALDLYSRVHMFQFDAIKSVLLWEGDQKDFDGNKIDTQKTHDFFEVLNAFKEEYFNIPPNASLGIHSQHISDRARKAYDIQQVVRHSIAWDSEGKDPSTHERDWKTMMQVSFDSPQKISKDRSFVLPEIKKVN